MYYIQLGKGAKIGAVIAGIIIVIVVIGIANQPSSIPESMPENIPETIRESISPITQPQQPSSTPAQPKQQSCDPSYPDVCIPVYPPDLDCDEIFYSNFRVTGNDPHGFDTDFDGIGCEVGSPSTSNPPPPTQPSCDPSYPDVCIPPYPPDLDCGEIGYSNFRVIGSDPHGFDRDGDGIGCES